MTSSNVACSSLFVANDMAFDTNKGIFPCDVISQSFLSPMPVQNTGGETYHNYDGVCRLPWMPKSQGNVLNYL